jgi:adenosine deaminase
MDLIFHRLILSSQRLLTRYLTKGPPNVQELKLKLFLEEREQNFQRPDHVYKSVLEREFHGVETLGSAIGTSLKRLSEEYLEPRQSRIHVRMEALPAWQRLITRVSPLLLVTEALRRSFQGRVDRAPDPWQEKLRLLRENLGQSTLPSAFCPHVEEIIETEGLSELHIHLNGTTEADIVWQDALRNPSAVYRNLRKGYRSSSETKEQYHQIEFGLTPSDVRRHLHMARHLRTVITEYIYGGADPTILADFFSQAQYREGPGGLGFDDSLFSHDHHPLHRHRSAEEAPETVWEAAWWWSVLDRLATDDGHLAPAVHLYLLLQGQFIRFIVQQINQNGFDQFQKITVNEFRADSEKAYKRRFSQLARSRNGDLAFLEGRFAPKEDARGNHKLLTNILAGYAYHNEARLVASGDPDHRQERRRWRLTDQEIPRRNRMDFGLVAHFIKEREETGDAAEWRSWHGADARPLPGAAIPRGTCRDQRLRAKNRRRARALIALYERLPLVRRYLVGVDAAANELHAPPEAFAPVFRLFRRHSFAHFTYHAGEDFRHLLSGMRAVAEAVEFLDLRHGNRIGHATALGIDPGLWWARIGGRVTLPLGEWLDNLVYAYAVLSSVQSMTHRMMGLRDQIGRHARRVYGDLPAAPDDLVRAWRLRRLDPLLALDPTLNADDALTEDVQAEWRLVTDARHEHPHAYELFRAYHSSDVRYRSSELIEATEAMCPVDLLNALQRASLADVVQREIVLESMLTSNVRISLYDDYPEHHIVRWLGLEGDLPPPPVVLASDDPGIFANCLRNEFLHLLHTLVTVKGVPRDKAVAILRSLNANGRTYRFRPSGGA